MKCEICQKNKALFKQVYNDDEYLWVCKECKDLQELNADMEYERQREEGII